MELELSSKNMMINYLTQEVTKIMNIGTKNQHNATTASAANDMLMF